MSQKKARQYLFIYNLNQTKKRRETQCYTFVTFASGPLTFKNAFDRMTPEVE